MTRLPDLLDSASLAEAERSALLLEGQIVTAIGGGALLLDAIDSPTTRARQCLAGRSSRFLAERRSAAWIWGALDRAPARVELCVDAAARTKPPRLSDAVLREVVIDPDEIAVLGGAAVTTRPRTILDVARTRGDDPQTPSLIRRLAVGCREELATYLERIDLGGRLPGKRAALELIERSISPR